MRPAAGLLAIGLLLVFAGFNAAACLDAIARLYLDPRAAWVIGCAWVLIGAALVVGALALIGRSAYRQINAEFPDHHGIGATDAETMQRQGARHD